jgi:S1-C subfamily serine protease
MRRSHTLAILTGTLGLFALGLGLGLGLSRTGWVPLAPPAHAAPALAAGESVADVVARISPGVVTVGAVKRTVVYQGYDDFFAPFFVRPRETRQRVPYLGSGFLIDREGHILTNFHVIEDSEQVFVTLQNGREYPAQVLEADRFTDIAMLKVDADPDDLPEPMALGDSELLRPGDPVLAIGNPFGNMIEDPRPTVTSGVISALHRSFRPDRANMRVYHDMIQTDAAINPGNSGGPLVDGRGRVVGINTMIVSPSGGSNGLGFAIPISRAKTFVNEIREHGRLRPLMLDFGVMSFNTPRVTGVIISNMMESGPAASVGLEVGDIITRVDGRAVSTRDEFVLTLASKQVGETLELEVWRSGKVRSVTYTVAEADKAPPRVGRRRL